MGARKLAQTQIIAVRGDRDKLAPQANFENNLRALAEAGLDVQQIEFSGGHHLDDALLVRLAQA
jgi:predicted esterase